MMDSDLVILVDRKTDRRLGVEEKMKAHALRTGHWHRAISVFVFNRKGETMLQQRDEGKYHSGGRWSNTCCSHPLPDPSPGEDVVAAAHRRLPEEMGFDCRMWEAFTFPYEAEVGNGLYEREYDHIIFGRYDGKARPNPAEVQDWKWMDLEELRKAVKKDPDRFTPWLRLMIDKVLLNYKKFEDEIRNVG
jgi:isopentenyl-diphosphate Delta-isomerase